MRKLLPLFVVSFGMWAAAPAMADDPCCGLDFTGDGIVSEPDMTACAACIGCECWDHWDVTGDGFISAADFIVLSSCFGAPSPVCESSTASAPVPAVSNAGLALLIGLLAASGAVGSYYLLQRRRG